MTIPENWASIDPPISNSPTLTSIINHSSSSKQSTTSKKHSSQYSEEDDEDSDSNSDSNSENSEDETVSTDSGSECSASSCSTCSDEYDSEESDSSCSSISSDHRKVKEKLKKQNNISSNSKSRFIVESRSAPKPLTKASVVSDFDHVNNHSSSPVMSQFKSGSISQAETLNAISQKSSSKLVTVQQPSKKNKSSNANVTRKFFKRKQQQQLQQQEIQQLQTLHNNATVRICRFFMVHNYLFLQRRLVK